MSIPTADGEANLLDLFEGRRQLIVYRFFLDPDMEGYPQDGCPGRCGASATCRR